ncbi:glycosyltransferase [Formosa algae]|uniref:glycosyltransferase n=1 Tax=Formosa algae TaxID=225843 RepID=UPI000CCDB153|nr:glycosyltransferase [Formosa algae]PNW29109.1 hypothetical protein BKP44_05835 [Formosa algae]
MKIGILIIFFNTEKHISSRLLESLSNFPKYVKLSLINNGSKDNTFEKLKMLEDRNDEGFSLIDIKKYRGIDPAIKAGVRYLSKNNDLKYIGYLNFDANLNPNYFIKIMLLIKAQHELMFTYNQAQEQKPFQRNLFKNIFSLTDWEIFAHNTIEKTDCNTF